MSFVIAEIGNNHEGSVENAQKLIDSAAKTGVDAIKLQVFRTDLFVSPSNKERFERLQKFELKYADVEKLAGQIKARGLQFIATPLDLESADFLSEHVNVFKIASGDNDFFPLIEKVARFGKPLIVSSGLASLAEVEKTVEFIYNVNPIYRDRNFLSILHCVSCYPAQPSELNLLAIVAMKRMFDARIGYSDHSMGDDACVAAVVLGAEVIEKHFTLDHHFSDFRDHQLSATQEEMARLVRSIKNVKEMLGTEKKSPCEREIKDTQAIRRSIVSKRDLKKGHLIELSDLSWVRPQSGMKPGTEDLLIGRKLIKDISAGHLFSPLDWED